MGEREWQVPMQKGAKDGWAEVPLWVMHAAYAIGKGRWMLKGSETVALPGAWIVERNGVVLIESRTSA